MIFVKEVAPDSSAVEIIAPEGHYEPLEEFREYAATLAIGLESSDDGIDKGAATIEEILSESNIYTYGKELFSSENEKRLKTKIAKAISSLQISAKEGFAMEEVVWEGLHNSGYDEYRYLTHEGLAAHRNFSATEPTLAPDDDFQDVLENDPEGIASMHDLDYNAICFEYNTSSWNQTSPSRVDERWNDIYGKMVDGKFIPVATVLNKDHPVRRAIAERQAATER
ncbi:MAG TPA: hypothetical protein VHC21_04840 [Candidatus Saccharimonadales bacterium]|nr:hypothetical protein [Candidatus Saccharimonadales bacterium]